MGEPRAITYKEVEKAGGNLDTWKRIGEMTGAGVPTLNADGNSSIDITSLSDAKRDQIDRLLANIGETEETAADTAAKKGKEK